MRLPDLPVMVTVAVAAAALAVAVKVTGRVPAVVAPKAAVTPEGKPDTVSATESLKPFKAVIAMALTPLAPAFTLKFAGVAESVKLGGVGMVTAIVVVFVVAPEVPVTVTVEVPGTAVDEARKVSVVMCVVETGLKVAATPVGRPVSAKLTDPLNPLCGATVMVLLPLPPCGTLTLAGDGVME